MSSNQPTLVAKLSGIELCNLKERHFDFAVDTFVTVSVDGEQQLQTEVVTNSLNPKWTFHEPHTLMVQPSSAISFQIYRRRNVFGAFGDKYIGELEQRLHTFVTNPNTPFDIDIRMNNVHWEKAKLKAVLVVDYHAPVDPLLDYAEGKLHGAMDRTSLATSTPTAEAMSALTHAMGSLDQLVNFVDGIADIHPIAKAAWMLLSSVHKALKFQAEQDSEIKELASELKETLIHARSCRDVKVMPGATNAVQELARLTAEGASLLDECMKYNMIRRAAKSAASKALHNRINDCKRRLKKHKKNLQILLLIDIRENVVIIKEEQREKQAPPPAATRTPSPAESSAPQCKLPHASPPHPAVPLVHRPEPPQHGGSLLAGYNYQPMYVTPSGTYYTPLPPIGPTSPISARTDSRGPPHRPSSPWLPPLDTGGMRSQSPQPMTLPPQVCCRDSYPPMLPIPLAMPSPSSSMSSMTCFSMDDDTRTMSSQSSVPTTPFDDSFPQYFPGRILPDEPFVEEPEGVHCCSDTTGCKRSQSLNRQKGVQREAHAMLWGPPGNMASSVSS